MGKRQLYRLATAVKERRKALGLSLEVLAGRSDVSRSLISKIENRRTVPSLPVILRIAQGLHTNLSELAFGIEEEVERDYQVIKKNERKIIEKEDAVGFQYQSLHCRTIGSFMFDSAILTLKKGSRRTLVTSDGGEFIFVLKGSVAFVLEQDTIRLEEGDSFYFDGRIPHVPKNVSEEEAELLVIYLIEKGRDES